MFRFLVSRVPRQYVRGMNPRERRAVLAGAITTALIFGAGAACSRPPDREMSAADKKVIADSLKLLVVSAYDLTRPDPVTSLMSLYPDGDSLISASGGGVVRTRAQLEQQIRTFWTYVGSNMQKPRWEWTSMDIDVLSPNAAVMTSTYRIPHATPQGRPHNLGGAWTAVFANRGGRWVIVQEHLSDAPSSPE
jgi:ketosteroid isomerase-like protein